MAESVSALAEDLFSGIYYDYDDELFSRGHWNDVEAAEEKDLKATVTTEELEERAQRSGGLQIS